MAEKEYKIFVSQKQEELAPIGTEEVVVLSGNSLKKVSLQNIADLGSGGGGGAVDSVNGQTGVVVLDADDISETATRKWQSANQNTFNDATSSIQTQIDSKLPISTFIDYSASSTIVGFSSYTVKKIDIILLGNGLGFCDLDIAGVSNSTVKSCTLNVNVVNAILSTTVSIINNGSSITNGGRMVISSGDNVIDFRRDGGGTPFTMSGNARVATQFFFQY